MKHIIAIVALLAAVAPTAALDADARRWEQLNEICVYGSGQPQICASADKLRQRLLARGYCTYGHGVVGRAGKGGRCFAIRR